MSNGEQWEFSKRIEDLEKITKRLETTEATAEENRTVLLMITMLAFGAMFQTNPHAARAGKDVIIRGLKSMGLSQQLLGTLEEIMVHQCESFEAR